MNTKPLETPNLALRQVDQADLQRIKLFRTWTQSTVMKEEIAFWEAHRGPCEQTGSKASRYT